MNVAGYTRFNAEVEADLMGQFLGRYARQRQLTTMPWDDGQHFGRTSFQWSTTSGGSVTGTPT